MCIRSDAIIQFLNLNIHHIVWSHLVHKDFQLKKEHFLCESVPANRRRKEGTRLCKPEEMRNLGNGSLTTQRPGGKAAGDCLTDGPVTSWTTRHGSLRRRVTAREQMPPAAPASHCHGRERVPNITSEKAEVSDQSTGLETAQGPQGHSKGHHRDEIS